MIRNRIDIFLCFSYVFILFNLSGCATTNKEKLKLAQETMPFCAGKLDCEAKWAAARRWIINNSRTKIQIYSDDLIETYNNPDPYSTNISARIVKEPTGKNNYAIAITVWCNNMFGCVPPADEAYIEF